MTTQAGNWVAESCSTLGTGDIILAGAATGQATFSGALAAGDVFYSIEDGTSRECGIGTYDGASTIVRGDIRATLVNGIYTKVSPLPITLTGTAVVSCTYNASAYEDVVQYAIDAEASELASAASAAAALVSETNAAASATAASSSASSAASSASSAAGSATTATTSATNAATSASNAATSETNASNSASAASTSATNAATSESNASTSATNAANSASTASTAASNASTSETNAAASETNAGTSETNAASSASSASSSASTATTKASEAATSASNASTSATNAGTSETNAASSASSAATSESNASTSETNAASSASSAAASYDDFDDRYLGAKASDPTLDNDGDALITGALYFNTTDDVMKVWEGSSWIAAYASLSGALIASNNLSDLDSATTALTNLGIANHDDITVDGSGNVGIGTSSPGARLQVDTATNNDGISITNTSTATNTSKQARLLFKGTDTVGTRKDAGSITSVPENPNYVNASMTFSTRSSDTLTERVRIDDSGNVGIGTSSPSTELDVDGDITATGSVILGNWSVTQSGTDLVFATGGTNKMKLDASGNLTVVGEVTAFGTV